MLETQHFPDSPNYPGLPTSVPKAGQTLEATMVFRFATNVSAAGRAR